jgi:hypothetical protein
VRFTRLHVFAITPTTWGEVRGGLQGANLRPGGRSGHREGTSAGSPTGATNIAGASLSDQRRMPRPDKEDTGGCDMGAYEQSD